MKLITFAKFVLFGIDTILFKRKNPIFATMILTDKCNLLCKHCAVNNVHSEIYSYSQIRKDMHTLFAKGVRVLSLSGGEVFLWQDGGKTLHDLVKEAKEIGFPIVTVATNGTFPIDIPEADFILVSLDGGKEIHNLIRGNTFNKIINNIRASKPDKVFVFMTINRLNKAEIPEVCRIAKEEKNIKAVSFNFHTPFPGTEELTLSVSEKEQCCSVISKMIKENFPVSNLETAFKHICHNNFPKPCHQNVVMENGNLLVCNRCIQIDGLCDQCGYFLTAEFTLMFNGNLRVIFDMLRTYLKYV